MKCDKLKRHRPDIMVVGEGKALAVMADDPMGVWCHIQDVLDILDEKDKEIALLKERICNGDVSRATWIDDCLDKDKEIADKDAKIVELNDKLQNVSELLTDAREWLIESQKMHKRCADNAIKQLRHQKYKRCEAMAKWCITEYIHSKCLDFTNTEQWYWRRWHIRWRKLAEKFKDKEAK